MTSTSLRSSSRGEGTTPAGITIGAARVLWTGRSDGDVGLTASVIGVAHVGWRGLEAGVIPATVETMRALVADHGACTACSTAWLSHRARRDSQRQATVVVL